MDPLTAFLCRQLYPPGAHPDYAKWEGWTIDRELVHQLILKALIEDAPEFLADLIPPEARKGRVWIEPPEKPKYDLRVGDGSAAVLFEIKIWSQLRADQIERQVAGAAGRRLYYLLFCQAAVDWSHSRITEATSGVGKKVSYRELTQSLAQVTGIAEPLATAYKVALLQQRDRIGGEPDL